jgi:phenylacetate-CoA ligase
MHLTTDYSHVELVDGFVVGTTYHNEAMPLVRYRLSDQTTFVPGQCSCGRPFPLIEPVTGKSQDREVRIRFGDHLIGEAEPPDEERATAS